MSAAEDLKRALDEVGLSPADWDRWAASRGRPSLLAISDEAAEIAASWVRGAGARRIRADLALLAHTCHARGCTVLVPPRMLMCLAHWRAVPRALQAAVLATYRPGQEICKDPTEAYLKAAQAAINAVAAREGRK